MNEDNPTTSTRSTHSTVQKTKALQRKICQLHYKGYTRVEIFLSLFYQHFDDEISEQKVAKWFRCIDEELSLRDKIDPAHWTLLLIVIDELNRLQHAISTWKCSSVSPKFLNSRYALQVEHSTNRLFLLDNFHGERRLAFWGFVG